MKGGPSGKEKKDLRIGIGHDSRVTGPLFEEAAAQGIVAGINAARYAKKEEPFVIDRSEGYIGVLIDDLVTKESHEPYRMMTSRSEYRLLLRQDNADIRLTPRGYEAGLISDERYQKLLEKKRAIAEEIDRVCAVSIGASEKVQNYLEECGSTPLKTSATLAELIRRPELNYDLLSGLDPNRPSLPGEFRDQVNIQVKYEGYIKRQEAQVHAFRKMESRRIPPEIDYEQVPSLRIEARQKLGRIRPSSVGQASRISGVSPADVSVLLVYLESKRNPHA